MKTARGYCGTRLNRIKTAAKRYLNPSQVAESTVINNLRNRVTDAIYRALFFSGAPRWLRRSDAVIFCYHNVLPDELIGRAGDQYLHSRLSDFADQLDWIHRNYTVVPISEIPNRLRNGQSVAGLAAFSFDDAYAGALRHAIPLMRNADLPFAVFPVIEGSTHRRPFWWDLFDDLAHHDRIRFLTEFKGDATQIIPQVTDQKDLADDALPAGWSEIRSILGDDCEIGVHTVTHRNLAMLSRPEIKHELETSRTRLETELQRTPSLVSYPYGLSNTTVQEVTKDSGFEAALGLASNLVRGGTPLFNVPRINVPAGITLESFACWSSGLKLRRKPRE